MSDKVKCPNCRSLVPAKRICERCGKPLPHINQTIAPPMVDPNQTVNDTSSFTSHSPNNPQPINPQPINPQPINSTANSNATAVNNNGEPTLEVDNLCVFFDKQVGFLRLRFNPGNGICNNVSITLTEQQTGNQFIICNGVSINRAHEFNRSFPVFDTGSIVFDVKLAYDKNGKHFSYEGDFATVCVGDGGARAVAESLVITINNHITGGHASEIHNSTNARDHLEGILSQNDNNIMTQLRNIVMGQDRAYYTLDLLNSGESLPSLPPQPLEAKTDRLVLKLGNKRLLLFSGRSVTFGRHPIGKPDLCDIVWNHPNVDNMNPKDPLLNPYMMISRKQCTFEHEGAKVVLIDGVRDESGMVKPTEYGTNFNESRVHGKEELTMGGTISFSSSSIKGSISLCKPGKVCENCPRSQGQRAWCMEGQRPSLVLKRNDGVPEYAVMVWSCFRLENVDLSITGVKIFCEDGGFAWRRGRECGWLVPGTDMDTPFGKVEIRKLFSPAEQAKAMK